MEEPSKSSDPKNDVLHTTANIHSQKAVDAVTRLHRIYAYVTDPTTAFCKPEWIRRQLVEALIELADAGVPMTQAHLGKRLKARRKK